MTKKEMYSPASAMMSYAYDAQTEKGAVKPPLHLSSTYTFPNAETGKGWFLQAYGLEGAPEGESGMIYSRLNHPNLDILEQRLSLWEGAEAGAAFASGMAAISTSMLTMLKPGDVVLFSSPIYGGTHHFLKDILPSWGIESLPFYPNDDMESISHRLVDKGYANRLAMIYIESPANPTNDLFDLSLASNLAKAFSTEEKRVQIAVDNTYLGPYGCLPLQHGADLVLYSATKYLGGHSDLLAGACLGSAELIGKIKAMRTFLGSMLSPFNAWLLTRSLETYEVRMERQIQSAEVISAYLQSHKQVKKCYYLGDLPTGSKQASIYAKQCKNPGAMLAFEVWGGEKEAFRFLNHLKLVKLAVSLGGTESLAEHPATMTHIDVPQAEKDTAGISDSLIRLSIGLEHPEDIIADLDRAFAQLPLPSPNLQIS